MTYCYGILFSVRIKWAKRKLTSCKVTFLFQFQVPFIHLYSIKEFKTKQKNPEMKSLYINGMAEIAVLLNYHLFFFRESIGSIFGNGELLTY